LRILFLHEVNYETKPIFEMHEFPEHLAAKGHEIGFVQFPEGQSKESLKKKPFKELISGRVVHGVNLTLFTPKTRSSGLPGRLLAVFRTGRFFKKVVKDFQPDVVVSFAVPTSGWQSLRVTKKAGVPYLFRALDVSHKIRKSIFSPLILIAEKYIYRNADWVSCNNVAMKRYCIDMGASQETTSVENPPLDLVRFSSAQTDSTTRIRSKLGIPADADVILYMGSFFYFSGLPELIQGFSSSRRDGEYLLLIGGGEQDSELRHLVTELGLHGYVKFTGFIDFDLLADYLKVAAIAVNPMHPSAVSNTAFPNKVIQYMATGLPVVSTELEGLRMTFGDSDGLAFVDDATQVYSKGQEMLDGGNLSELGKSNQSRVQADFSIANTVEAMGTRLANLIEEAA